MASNVAPIAERIEWNKMPMPFGGYEDESGLEYRKCRFMMQLPYLNEDGNAFVIDIKPVSAYELVERRVCRIRQIDGDLFLLVPIITAAQNVVFQEGHPAV